MVSELTEFEQKALTVVSARDGALAHWSTGDQAGLELGQVVWLYSRGKVRQGVVSKLTLTRAEVTYTTEGALRDAYASCDLLASGKGYWADLGASNPDAWNRQTPEWQQARRDDLAEARLGHYQRFVTFTHKTVARSQVFVVLPVVA